MILHFVEEFAPRLRGARLLGWWDNSTSVSAVNKGTSVSNLITGIVRRILLLCLEYDVWLWLAHIQGVLNLDPDRLSRGLLGRRVGDWSLLPHVMACWVKAAGGFDWD
eukprot:1401830-Rhodomonas_salina.1